MFTLVKRLGIAFFSSAHIFLDLLKVFGLLVALLYIFGKKLIFFKAFGFSIIISVREANTAYMFWCIPNVTHSMFIEQIWSKNFKLLV